MPTVCDLVALVRDFQNYYIESPSMQQVHLGCDCGCGGDYFSVEEWDEIHDLGNKAKESLKIFCLDYNIDWDYD